MVINVINAIELIEPKCQICRTRTWFDKSNKSGHWTNTAATITDAWLNEGLKPRCITRDLKWGTQVPLEGYTDKVTNNSIVSSDVNQ